MKKHSRNLLCLMFAFMLAVSVLSMACASEALIGQMTRDGHTIVSIQYAYNEAGVVHLYDEAGETIVATIGSGAALAVTDGQQEGRTFVQFGATSGWIDNNDLYDQLPQNVTGQLSGSSAPANQLTPIQTAPSQQKEETVPETDDSENDGSIDGVVADEETESTTDAEEPVETVGDPEKDHEPIAAMYEEEASDAVAVDVVQLGVVTSIILLDEERMEVETALLTFGEEIPEEQKLGYVHAPRTGQAGLRETPDKTGKVITQLKAGQLVAVLALEDNYAHVNVRGVEGWLRLDCLKYLQETDNGFVSSGDLALADPKKDTGDSENDPATAADAGEEADTQESSETAVSGTNSSDSGDEQTEIIITGNTDGDESAPQTGYPTKALLSCKGETDGATSVNLRNLPTKDSAKTAVWRTGVEVTVLSYRDGWYLVEADGVCGYVMEAFVAMEG